MIYILKSVEKLIFNGIDIGYEIIGENNTYDSYFIINSVYGRGIEGVENNLISVPGREGAYSAHTYRPPRYLNVSVTIKGTSFHDLRKKLERLNSILNTDGKNVPITFDDELDRIYYGKLDQVSGGYEKSHIYQAVITFICPDPYKYSTTEKNLLFPTDIVTIENNGTAEALPIFELEATQKTTFAMVSNQDDEYNLVGQHADVDEQVIDEKTTIFDETGDTLSEWTVPSGYQGSFKAESNGIFVESYGTGDSWHGPGLIREIEPTEDFEIEFYTSVRTERPEMAFRLSTNFFDENMNELGMLRVWNKSTSTINKVIEARIGPYTGTQFENYLISSANYNWMGQRVYNGIIRVTRKGNVYTFYAAHITQRGNHIESITKRYVDTENKYAGRLKFIRMDAAIFGSYPKPNELSIRRIRVTKHNKVLVDQTPYILYPGDILEFDHVEKDIRLNGESRKDLKNFGASFFTLKKGENMLVVTPENSFRTRVKFRERYL